MICNNIKLTCKLGPLETYDGKVIHNGHYAAVTSTLDLPCGHKMNMDAYVPLPEGIMVIVNEELSLTLENVRAVQEEACSAMAYNAGLLGCEECRQNPGEVPAAVDPDAPVKLLVVDGGEEG